MANRFRCGRKQPVRLLQEPDPWIFAREPKLGTRLMGGFPSLLSRLMGNMQSHLDEMDRLRVVLLDAYPPLALETASPSPAARKGVQEGGASQELKPRAQDTHRLVLDLNGFAPAELTVKLEGRKLTVFGKHEKVTDAEDGCVSREYREVSKEVLLPADASLDAVACALSRDGHLCIEAPRLERTIPITVSMAPAAEASEETGQPEAAANAEKEQQGASDQ